jgi:polygalacturonase
MASSAAVASVARAPSANLGGVFDVKQFGAAGNGKNLDSPAVNRAIAAAAAAGGGTVHFPAGTYACHSIRLQSFVALYLEAGATILAAPAGGYDAAESNAPWEGYQDFGHNHWHNSLIWGEHVHDIGLYGPGLIWGRGLSRGEVVEGGLPAADTPGAADKAVALKRCYNVTLRDIAILAGGHFGILATGVDNLTLDDLKIDTNRDGMNIDCCRNVRISGCSVNSPSDDGICLKSSFALGEARATENVTISDCYVSGGWQIGTMLDGTFKRLISADPGEPTGRIKCGTESNGGFRNIAISNCVFESCRGFALESVDGGPIENITFTGITMRDIRNAPFFLRLGARLRGPQGTSAGTLRRVIISNITCEAVANAMPAIISGIPDHPVEDISISDVYMVLKGGGAAALADINPPERERDYPEPNRLGPLPAAGLFVRHARNLDVRHVEIAHVADDGRPCIWLNDVDRADFVGLRLPPGGRAPSFSLRETRRFRVSRTAPLADVSLDYVASGVLP